MGTRIEKDRDARFLAALRDVRALRDLELAALLDEFTNCPRLRYLPLVEEAARRLGLRPT
jgi:hypothetical protein